jgi:hypothetical protein
MSMDNKKVETQAKPFKRLNFFNGFFTTAQDWQDGETYHMEKRKLHNRGLHTPGVLYEDEATDIASGSALQVTSAGKFTIKVAPGAALDRQGNLIFWRPEEGSPEEDGISLKRELTETYKDKQALCIGIEFDAVKDDEVDVGGYRDHTRITEKPRIVVWAEGQPNTSAVPLASVKVPPPGSDKITQADITDHRESAGPKGLQRIRELIQTNRDYHDDQVNKLNKLVQNNYDHHNAQVERIDKVFERLGKTVGEHNGDINMLQESSQKVSKTVDRNREHTDGEVKRLDNRLGELDKTSNDNVRDLELDVGENCKLHDRALHTPGILFGQKDDLAVVPHDKLEIMVLPGFALDAFGRLLEVAHTQTLGKVPATEESKLTFVVAEANTEAGHQGKRFTYPAKITIQEQAADVAGGQIELARIQVAPHATQIRPADDAEQSWINKIDRSRVVWAGAVNRKTEERLAVIETALFQRLPTYLIQTRGAHNQGLHTPGIVPRVDQELMVIALPGKGRQITVQKGMALDIFGNELHILAEKTLEVAVPKHGQRTAYVVIHHRAITRVLTSDPHHSFHVGDGEAQLDIRFAEPDNESEIELARIHLLENVETEGITNPHGEPRGNQIDRRNVIWASGHATATAAHPIPGSTREKLVKQLDSDRKAFAALATHFPTPALDDLRHALVNLAMMVRAQTITLDKLPTMLAMIATMITDVIQETGERYPAIHESTDYRDWDSASERYRKAITDGKAFDDLLDQQRTVADQARRVANRTLPRPAVTVYERKYQVTASGDYATLRLTVKTTTDEGVMP